jgi:hypothetical protein
MTDTPAACDRFEREGLLQREQEQPLDPHFETCPDCRRARAAYEALKVDLADGGGATAGEPPPQWQARVWAEIARREAAPRRRRWWWAAPVAATAAVVLFFALRGLMGLLAPLAPLAPPPSPTVELAVTVVRGEEMRRGSVAQPGDRLEMEARMGEAAHGELRLYRDDAELLLHCTSAAVGSVDRACEREGSTLRAAYSLSAVGRYQVLLLISESPLPTPTGAGLDADAGAALQAGARVELGEEVRVE